MPTEMPDEVLPKLRAAFEATGSGAWLMRAILDCGLDVANGYRLELKLGDDRMRGASHATEARLISGEVDVIDTDWLSLARHRAVGLPLVAAVPYGAIFGGLVVPAAGRLGGLPDLFGARIGVVHVQDKNWLLLRAICRLHHGFDPAEVAQCIETGSKSALLEALRSGRLDAALVYWHQVPALVADGAFREVCDFAALLTSVPAARAPVPTSFFVFHESLLQRLPALGQGFACSVAAAVVRLRTDADFWGRMSGVAPDSPAGATLRLKWLARIGLPWQPGMAGRLRELAGLLTPPDSAQPPCPAGGLAAGFLI